MENKEQIKHTFSLVALLISEIYKEISPFLTKKDKEKFAYRLTEIVESIDKI
jgi:hypothetical protein